jgi:hypothetical protein
MARYVKKKKSKDPSYSRKSKSKFTPAERFLRFQIRHTENQGEVSHFIDIAKELSKVNRRLYRQGMVYRIANISITSRDTVNGLISFSTASETWVTRNAWNRGFNMWNKMNDKVLELQPARKNPYHDYKVYLTQAHKNAASAQKPSALDNENNEIEDGEWAYSLYQSPDGTTGTNGFTAHLLGDHDGTIGAWNSISLVKSYGEGRATVPLDAPMMDDEGDDDPLLNLFDDGAQTDEIAQVLDSYGDRPPYSIGSETTVGERYVGSELNAPEPIVRRLVSIGTADQLGGVDTAGVSAPTVMVPGFDVTCGLLEIETQSSFRDKLNFRTDEDVFDVIIELAPGNYKGVAAFDI